MTYHGITKEFIFEGRQPFESCHASTLALLPEGDIAAAWFGGTREGAPDVGIWYSGREKGIWRAPRKLSVQEGIPHWNPVLFRGEQNTIHLFYKVGHTIPRWITMVTTSEDAGHTWKTPEVLVEGDEGGRGPVKNKPIRLADGTWLAPASIEGEKWEAFADRSCDRGRNWVRSIMVPVEDRKEEEEDKRPSAGNPAKGLIQPTLWESEPGTVHMLLRSTWGKIYRSDSKDSGKTWTQAYPTVLPNNNSGIDITRLDNGVLALVYNPVGKNWGPRTPLVLNISRDNGTSWETPYVLEDDEGEYSYPAVVSKGNEVFITYTWKREKIAFWKISIDP